MANPVVTVEQIEFLPADTTKRALPLLVAEQPVAPPEWVRGVQSLPVAYVSPRRSIRLLATFVCTDPTIREAQVRAIRLGPAPRSIGAVPQLTVKFDAAGRSQPTPCRAIVTSGKAINLDHVVWEWQFKRKRRWFAMNKSEHDIAVTLAAPKAPWTKDVASADATLPWWEVLRLACGIAQGATTARSATTKVTEAVYRDWGGTYFKYASIAGGYASNAGSEPTAFDCARFLRLLNGQPAPAELDCSEVATIVSTFAAILGCDVSQLVIHESLECNPIRLVGTKDWELSFSFGLHEVAFEGALIKTSNGRRALASSRIWDGCLEVSGDRQIQNGQAPGNARLPASIQDKTYMSRLLSGAPTSIGEHHHSGPSSRRIGTLPVELEPIIMDPFLKKVAKAYGFSTWNAPTSDQPSVTTFDLSALTIPDWFLVPETGTRMESARRADAIVSRTLWIATGDPTALMVADLYVCSTAAAARFRILALLARFGSARFRRTDRPPTGREVHHEVEFTAADGSAVIRSFRNIVLVVRRASLRDQVQPPQVRAFFNVVHAALTAAR